MPRKSNNQVVAGRFFRWILKRRRNTWCADGRSNKPSVGRHSLGTPDRAAALRHLERLDRVKAAEFGLADKSLLTADQPPALDLARGVKAYIAHLSRPAVAGGTSARTRQRYQAVFDKFVSFAKLRSVHDWQDVTKKLLTAYLTNLEERDYAERSIYFEGTLVKQLLKWAVAEDLLPAACTFALPLRKVSGTSSYCWKPAEVQVMIEHCQQTSGLKWLADVILVLSRTGLRIGEAAALRWTDIDFERNIVRVTNDPEKRGPASAKRRRTKNRRDRCFPIHEELRPVFQRLPHLPDGRVLHGPRGGVLKADTLRTILLKHVIKPLAARFPSPPGEPGFKDGRLHSFRHFFCSRCASERIPERTLMDWLGHQNSAMIRVYFHQLDEDAQRCMKKLDFTGEAGGNGVADTTPGVPEAYPNGQTTREVS